MNINYNRPAVSVVIPSYNRAHCIRHAVESARASRFVHEVIVVDDASDDNTNKVLARLAEKDKKLRVVRHEINRGVSAARNSGIEAAEGNHIAFLDSDDLWHRAKVGLQLLALSVHKDPNAFCLSYYVGRRISGKPVRPIKPKPEDTQIQRIFLKKCPGGFAGVMHESFRKRWKGGSSAVRDYEYAAYTPKQIEKGIVLHQMWFGIGSTLLAKREAIERNGQFDEQMGYAEETEYVVRHLCNNGSVQVVPLPLMMYSLPPEDKIYPKEERHHQAMLENYRCKVVQKYGVAVASDFIEGHLPAATEFNMSTGKLLEVNQDAPCRSGFRCAFRGKVCAA